MSSRSNDVSSPIREDSAQFDPLSPSPSKTKKPMMQRAMRKVRRLLSLLLYLRRRPSRPLSAPGPQRSNSWLNSKRKLHALQVYKSFTAPEKDADGQRISLSRSLSKRFGRRESGASSQTLVRVMCLAQLHRCATRSCIRCNTCAPASQRMPVGVRQVGSRKYCRRCPRRANEGNRSPNAGRAAGL